MARDSPQMPAGLDCSGVADHDVVGKVIDQTNGQMGFWKNRLPERAVLFYDQTELRGIQTGFLARVHEKAACSREPHRHRSRDCRVQSGGVWCRHTDGGKLAVNDALAA